MVDSLVITDEVSFGGTSQADFDVNSLRVNNNIVWHAGNDGAGSGLVASDVSCTNCLTNTEVASADVASDLSCTGCIGTTEIEDIYVLNTGDTMTGNLTIQKNENPNLSITAINAGADPAITAAIRIKGYEGRGKGIFLTDADTTNEWFIGETYSSTGLSLGYDTTTNGQSEYPASSALFIDTSRNVGIGDTTPTEGKLVVAGNIYTTGTVITSTINKTSGNLTIQTTTSGDIILTPASGEVKINGDLDIGSYKLSAGEIDPRYRIDDIVYATYGHSTTGLKEETTGKVKLTKKDNGLYSYTIDFSKVEKASDLWLFKEITAFGENWNDLVVSLTPEGRAEVWYEMDKENGFLHIFGNKSVKVSYRLIAPRFDWPERDTNLYQGDSKDSSMGMKVR